MNYAAAHFSSDVFRKVAVIHFDELYPEVIQHIIQKNPLGLLIILPEASQAKAKISQLKIWDDIQNRLVTESIVIPVYFAFETQALMELYQTLLKQAKSSASSNTP